LSCVGAFDKMCFGISIWNALLAGCGLYFKR
jgi:hypothetical protein